MSNHETASKEAVLFPDELEIVEVVGERFQAGNWFMYMSDRLRERRIVSDGLDKMKGPNILGK